MEFFQEEWDAIHSKKVIPVDPHNTIFKIKTGRKFFYRLWFLISAPIIWLTKGEINIK